MHRCPRPHGPWPRSRPPAAPEPTSSPCAGVRRCRRCAGPRAALLLFLVGGCAQLAGAPAWSWWTLYLACYATGGWEPAWAGLQALREQDPGRRPADGRGRARRGGDRAGLRRRAADRHLRDFRRAGGVRHPAHRGLGRAACSTWRRSRPPGSTPTASERGRPTADLRGRRPRAGPARGAGRRGRRGRWTAPARSTRPRSPVSRCPWLKQLGDEVFAGTLNGTGALRVRVQPCRRRHRSSPASSRWCEEASRDQGADPAVHREGRAALLRRRGGRDPGAVRDPAAARRRTCEPTLLRAMTFMIVASPCAVVLATMPPLLAAIANAGRHGVLVKSAVVMEQLGQTDAGRLRQDRHAHRGHAPRRRGPRSCPGPAWTPGVSWPWPLPRRRPSEHPLARAVVAARAPSAASPWHAPGLRVHARPRRTRGRGGAGGARRSPRRCWWRRLGPRGPRRRRGRPGRRCGRDRAGGRRSYGGRGHPRRRAGGRAGPGRPAASRGRRDRRRAGRPRPGAAPILLTGDNQRAAAPAGRRRSASPTSGPGCCRQDKVAPSGPCRSRATA